MHATIRNGARSQKEPALAAAFEQHIGLAEFSLAHHDSARTYLQTAVALLRRSERKLNPARIPALYNLARVLGDLGERRESLRMAKKRWL